MSPEQRAELVRQARLEIKQRRSEAEVRNETERQRAAAGWLRAVDSRRPKLRRDAGNEERAQFRQRLRSYEQDICRRGGFAVGERLRAMREGEGFGVDRSSPIAQRMIRRSNVRLSGRLVQDGAGLRRSTFTSGILTPSERLGVTTRNADGSFHSRLLGVGEAARRRTAGRGDIDGALAEASARNARRRRWF